MDFQNLKSNESHHEKLDNNSFVYLWNENVCKVDKLEDLLHFSPSELIGCTFLYKMENKEKLRAEVARKLNDWDIDNHKNIKFILNLGNMGIEQVMSYVEVCDRIEAMIEA